MLNCHSALNKLGKHDDINLVQLPEHGHGRTQEKKWTPSEKGIENIILWLRIIRKPTNQDHEPASQLMKKETTHGTISCEGNVNNRTVKQRNLQELRRGTQIDATHFLCECAALTTTRQIRLGAACLRSAIQTHPHGVYTGSEQIKFEMFCLCGLHP